MLLVVKSPEGRNLPRDQAHEVHELVFLSELEGPGLELFTKSLQIQSVVLGDDHHVVIAFFVVPNEEILGARLPVRQLKGVCLFHVVDRLMLDDLVFYAALIQKRVNFLFTVHVSSSNGSGNLARKIFFDQILELILGHGAGHSHLLIYYKTRHRSDPAELCFPLVEAHLIGEVFS